MGKFRSRVHWADFALFFTSVFFILTVATARAEDFRYQNIIPGEKAAGMGGAFTAIADDTSAILYNPAGLVFVVRDSISMSANMYGLVRADYSNAFGSGNNFTYSNVNIAPSAFAFTSRLGEDSTFGFGVFELNNLSYSSTMSAIVATAGNPTKFNEEITWNEEKIGVGAAYGKKVGAYWNAGVTLLAIYETYNQTMSTLVTQPPVNPTMIWNQDYSESYKNLSLLLKFGLLFTPSDNFSTGITVSTPSTSVWGSGYIYNRDSTAGVVTYLPELTSNSSNPLQIRGGMAWGTPHSWKIAGDVTYIDKTTYNVFPDLASTKIEKIAVYNYNAGLELWQSSYFLRVGAFTNNSASPAYNPSSYVYEDVSQIGYTLGVGYEKEKGTVSVGINYLTGSGKWPGVDNSGNTVLSNVSQQRLYLFVGSSSTF